uniref:Protein zer-1 homolog n=1 Tax=Lepeophtheirus salmonis TaxID=72036 RepID=A0A0K2TYN5_LEPSM
MERFKTIWEPNSPDSLTDIVTRYCLRNPSTYSQLFEFDSKTNEERLLPDKPLTKHIAFKSVEELLMGKPKKDSFAPRVYRRLHPGIHLPAVICEKFFSIAQEEGIDVNDAFINVFADTESTPLRSVSINGSSITNNGLDMLLKHRLRDLEIQDCLDLNTRSFGTMNEYSNNLVNLTVGRLTDLLPHVVATFCCQFDDECDCEGHPLDYNFKAYRLSSLCINDIGSYRGEHFIEFLLKSLVNLTHLDLSGLFAFHHMQHAEFLKQVPKLVSLVLYNVIGIEAGLKDICQLKKLKHLDISRQMEYLQRSADFKNPYHVLKEISENLPELESLDISGTNLDDCDVCDGKIDSGCDIRGLESRVGNPLRFLGLYNTRMGACSRTNIPALEITGDANERQIIAAGRHYIDRQEMIYNVLNDLYHIFRFGTCNNLKEALDIIVLGMQNHITDSVIQISGSASLYYVLTSPINTLINVKMKRKIIVTLLNAMFNHKKDSVMMRNGCITLCQFDIPKDVLFDYERLVRILLYIVSHRSNSPENMEESNFLERASIFLLNSLACQVDGQQKLLVGSLGAMERMLDIIRHRVDKEICDHVMEIAWSTLWNVTDETPINCKRFLDNGGMKLFLQCKDVFPDRQELLRNMMGLLGNVAEVPSLRPQLMTREFVAEFSMLLDSNTDGIEVSYNAAGVLAHMASDGPSAWTIEDPSRVEVLSKMVVAIQRWNLHSSRNINYRSFEPILRLVNVHHTPQCQHWAMWALANLTFVDNKYCALVEQEGGLSLLDQLLNGNFGSTLPYSSVLELAATVRDNVTRWKNGRSSSPIRNSHEDGGDDNDAID